MKIIGIIGWKNSGKTFFVSKIIKKLKLKNLNVASIKHAHHKFDVDQKDTDSLPEYNVLDEILKGLVEKEISVEKIVTNGFDRDVVEKTAKLLAKSEYKRFQAAPGPKVTNKAFGRDRRFPLTSGFRNWN